MTTSPPCRTLRPNFGPSAAPEVAAPIARPTASGVMARPVCIGVKPRPSWMNRLTISITPFIATKNDARNTTPATKPRLRNSERSMTGWALRRSLTTNPAKTSAEAAIIRKHHTGQSCSRPWTSG